MRITIFFLLQIYSIHYRNDPLYTPNQRKEPSWPDPDSESSFFR